MNAGRLIRHQVLRRTVLLLTIGSLWPSLIGATELDLQAVISLALERNPRFREVLESRREVESGVAEAKADAWPEVDLLTNWGRSRDPSFLTGADFEEIIELFPGFEPQEQEIWSLAFEVRQALYSSGKVRAGIEAAGLVVELADAQVAQAQLDTAAAAAEAYFEAQAARHSLEVVLFQEQARKESLAVVEARFELGEATRLEQLRARASLAALVPEVARFRGAVTTAESHLRRVLSLAPNTPIEILPTSPSAEPPLPMDHLVKEAWDHRPELQGLQVQDRLLSQRQVVTRADGRPQLELTGRFGRRSRDIEDLGDSLFDDWRVGIGFSWSVFDGGRRRGQIAQLESQRAQVAWQVEALENEIAFEITNARSALETALLRLDGAKAAAAASSEATRVARESYREGVALQADLLAAQEQEITAELERIDASRVARVESARLRRAIGQSLLTDPGAERASEAIAVTAKGDRKPLWESSPMVARPFQEKDILRCPSASWRAESHLLTLRLDDHLQSIAETLETGPSPRKQLQSEINDVAQIKDLPISVCGSFWQHHEVVQ